VIEEKRQAGLAAPRSGSAWGEVGMAPAAQDIPPEAMVCYRRAIDLDPNDGRWPYLLALDAGIHKTLRREMQTGRDGMPT
jgi:hypothetical protein